MEDRKIELKEQMTPKQVLFCSEYILDWNASRAARDAGYAEKTAGVTACNLLKDPKIKEYIELVKNDIEGELGITKLSMMKILKKLAIASVADVYTDWMTREDFSVLKENNPDLLEAIQEIQTKTEKVPGIDDEIVEVEYVKIKMYDKRLVIQDIFKAMGWNASEKMDIRMNSEQPLFGDDPDE